MRQLAFEDVDSCARGIRGSGVLFTLASERLHGSRTSDVYGSQKSVGKLWMKRPGGVRSRECLRHGL